MTAGGKDDILPTVGSHVCQWRGIASRRQVVPPEYLAIFGI